MRICIAADHAGVGLKDAVAARLRDAGHEVTDLGTNSGDSVDYPDYAARVGSTITNGAADRGVLVCGTGIGMSIAANKVPGIRAALVHDPITAQLAAAHNDANVLCLGARLLAEDYAWTLVETWLATVFEARHGRRLDKIAQIERSASGRGDAR